MSSFRAALSPATPPSPPLPPKPPTRRTRARIRRRILPPPKMRPPSPRRALQQCEPILMLNDVLISNQIFIRRTFIFQQRWAAASSFQRRRPLRCDRRAGRGGGGGGGGGAVVGPHGHHHAPRPRGVRQVDRDGPTKNFCDGSHE